jgi:hypothetical protein
MTVSAWADQSATIKCTGPNIILETRTPYLGETYGHMNQVLYILKSDFNENEVSNTAYFLSIRSTSEALS